MFLLSHLPSAHVREGDFAGDVQAVHFQVRELRVGGVAGRPEGDGVEPGGGKVDVILQPLVLVDHAHLKRIKQN